MESSNAPKDMSAKQRELLTWFRVNATPFAEAYEGAIHLLDNVSFPGRVHFIAHAVRDIADRLVFALDPQMRGARVQYEQKLDEIGKLWPGLDWANDSEDGVPGHDSLCINNELASRIDSLVNDHRDRRARPSNYELLFRFLMRNEPSRADVNERLVAEFKRVRDWFMGRTHLRASRAPEIDEDELHTEFRKFEGMLHSFVGDFFTGTAELDKLVRQGKPDNEQVNAVITLLSSPQHEAYFFSQSEDPLWIPMLAERNVFKNPPKPEVVEGGGTRYPQWAATRYLARMAVKSPTEVAKVFAEMETDNASVIGDMLRAALAMPAKDAKSLVPSVCRAAKTGTLWLTFNDASGLCVRLAEGGEAEAAMELAEGLFTPTFEDGQEEVKQRDKYWYQEGLQRVVPALASRKPCEFLPKMCDWLAMAIKAKGYDDTENRSDFSYSWRPAIEEHGQNHDYDLAGVLVGLVREGFEVAIRSKSIPVMNALEIIEGNPYTVFKRIRLHLIGEFADQLVELCRREIMRHELFDDYEFKHEYAMLVGRRLDLLTPAKREDWFGWIDEGPDMSDFEESFEEHRGHKPKDEDRQRRIDYWQFEKLHWVRTHLKGDRQRFYKEMLSKHGEPDMADLNFRIGSVLEMEDSPMTVEDLQSMTFEEAVEKVSAWRPDTSRFMGPNVEGLRSTFMQYVATRPEEFSTKAGALVDRSAPFVRGFLAQMTDVAKNGREIDLGAILDLCLWVAKRPVGERTTPVQEDEILADKDWQWTRERICEFIEEVCKAERGDRRRYGMENIRKTMWKLIEAFSSDSAESYIVRDISKDDHRVHEYLDLGINSPRGKAVRAGLEYARWVGKHIEQSEGKRKIVPGGFDAMPEVRDMLNKQIAVGNRNAGVLSIIGSEVSLIYWIDRKWLAENAGKIFQLESIEKTPEAGEGWAAWNAFLVWVRPHIEFYRIFESQFAYAVNEAAKVKLTKYSDEQPMYRLGEHLMLLYGRGQLGMDDDGGLLREFLDKAHPEIRRHTIGFVGRSLRGEGDVPEEAIERLMVLWDSYWGGQGKNDAKEKGDAWLFGPWFSCGKFPKQWALDCLEEFVKVVPTPEPDDAIVEKLAQIASTDIVKSVHILDIMARGDREGWKISSWRDSAKDILGQAMKTTGEAQKKAVALISYFGRHGYSDFGELLADERG